MAWMRETSFGQLVRLLTGNRCFQYPEEQAGFVIPFTVDNSSRSYTSSNHEKAIDAADPAESPNQTSSSFPTASIATDVEAARQPSVPDDSTIIIHWYSPHDPENPKNWPRAKKLAACTCINVYTAAVYMGSSIFTSSYAGILADFPSLDLQLVSLGLSMYVLAYGLGPLLWSPLSEVPSIGRNPPYILTFALYTIFLVPAALTRDSFAGLVVLRFLQGFFGSPCLATGGATVSDLYSRPKLAYMMSMWTLFATTGPSVGPLLSGFSIPAVGDWRWSMWIMLWFAAPVWMLMLFILPETSADNILVRRAQRMRKLTGDPRYQAHAELAHRNRNLRSRDVVLEALWRPIQLMIMDPSIGFTAVYTALIYGIYYSFFEAFPLVYQREYGFNLGEQGLVFLSITIGSIVAVACYWLYTYRVVEPALLHDSQLKPERRLIPAIYAAFILPAGLFLFAWTATPSIHVAVSSLGIAAFAGGILVILQCVFVYLELAYPQYAASLFAGNDLARSSLAAGTIHFSQPLYHRLGVAQGVTLLGGLTAGCLSGILILFFYGEWLRARSRFAVSS